MRPVGSDLRWEDVNFFQNDFGLGHGLKDVFPGDMPDGVRYRAEQLIRWMDRERGGGYGKEGGTAEPDF